MNEETIVHRCRQRGGSRKGETTNWVPGSVRGVEEGGGVSRVGNEPPGVSERFWDVPQRSGLEDKVGAAMKAPESTLRYIPRTLPPPRAIWSR